MPGPSRYPPPPPPADEPLEKTPTATDSIIGQTIVGADGRFYTVVDRPEVRLRRSGNLIRPAGIWVQDAETGEFVATLPAGVYDTGGGFRVQVDSKGTILSSRSLPADMAFGGAGGSGGGSAPAFSGTPAGMQMEAELLEQQAQREFNRTLKLQKLQEAANLRERAMAELNDLRLKRIDERTGARQNLTEMAGEDVFRTIGTLRARAVQGPTLIDQFKGELGQAAGFKEPMISPTASMSDLESAIAKLSQPITPQGGASSPFRPTGLEHGGEIGKEGEVTPFSMGRPDPFTAIEMAPQMGMTPIIVGERGGGPELMLAPKGTKVIPLTDDEEDRMMNGPFNVPGAATGGTVGSAVKSTFGTTGTGPNFGLEPIQDLFRSFGGGPGSTKGIISRGRASALGAFQRAPGSLFKAKGGDKVYVVDEEGKLRWVTNPNIFQKSGFDRGNIQTLWQEQLNEFERGADVNSPFTLPPGQSGGALGAPLSTFRGFQELFIAQGVPAAQASKEAQRLSDLLGFLQSPRKVGRAFDRLDPAEQDALLSAWALSGIPKESALAQIERTGISGRARSGIFTG